MASIRKRNGKFQAVIRRSGFKTHSRTFNKKKDALEWACEIELKADRRGMPDNIKSLEKTTLSDLLIRYRDNIIPQKRSSKNETIIINAFLRLNICKKSLAEITSHDFDDYRQKRLKNVLGSTINREFNIIRHAYNTAINVWELPISKNPLDSLKKAPTPQSRTRRLTNGERERLLEQCALVDNKIVKRIVVFALETGMRRSEILNVQYNKHIDFEKRTLHIPNTKNGHPRTIPLSKNAIEAIGKPKQKGYTFPIHAKALEYHWKNVIKSAKLIDLRFHDLRHIAITSFFERGLTVPEVATISGHLDYKVLAKYVHLRAEDIVNKL